MKESHENATAWAAGCSAVLAVAILLLLPFCTVWSIEGGHVGVVKSFGAVQDETLPAGGPYLVKPWKFVTEVSCQTTRNEEAASVPTKGGLTVSLKAILLYKLDPAGAAGMIREVGDKYEEKVIDPYFRNATRDACAEYEPEALYTTARNEVEGRVFDMVRKGLEGRGVIVEAVMLQEPQMPDVVKGRIEAKVAAEQDALRMAFVFKQREQEGLANKRVKELEAEAKVIEAKGIADAQAIIKKDLDDNYLRYLWIQALRENHGATVYVPTGPDGMPFFKSVHGAGEKK
jgi:regulator of protease activity HflC (stomatin/prohibitin superfamily)